MPSYQTLQSIQVVRLQAPNQASRQLESTAPASVHVSELPEGFLFIIRQGGDKWKCGICTYLNNSEEVYCSICDSNRPELTFGEQIMFDMRKRGDSKVKTTELGLSMDPVRGFLLERK